MKRIVLYIHLLILLSFIFTLNRLCKEILINYQTNLYIYKVIIKNTSIAVSIVIPTFNRAVFLNRSLTVCQSQTLTNIEIICVDDCSTDWTRSLVIERMKKDPRIKLVQNLYNQGVILSRFNGVFISAGTYIITLDSDDLIYTTTAECAYIFSIMRDADIIDYKSENYAHNNKLISDDWHNCNGSYYNNSAVRNAFGKRLIGINIWKKFIKRSLLINAINFIYPFVKDKKICLAEDEIIVGSVLLFSSNFYCCKEFPAYIHFMGQEISVEAGKLQSKLQNSLQVKYAQRLLNYLYTKNDFHDCSVQEFLKNKKNRYIFKRLNTVTNKTIQSNCNIEEKYFIHKDYNEKGYCVLIKQMLR